MNCSSAVKGEAAQRLAISRVRQNRTSLTEATVLDVPPSSKIAQIEHVGCMAVLDCMRQMGTVSVGCKVFIPTCQRLLDDEYQELIYREYSDDLVEAAVSLL